MGPHASFNKCWSECHGSSLSATKFYRMLFNMQFFPSQYCFRYEKALVFYPLKKQKKIVHILWIRWFQPPKTKIKIRIVTSNEQLNWIELKQKKMWDGISRRMRQEKTHHLWIPITTVVWPLPNYNTPTMFQNKKQILFICETNKKGKLFIKNTEAVVLIRLFLCARMLQRENITMCFPI